jgi:hypothetical protein
MSAQPAATGSSRTTRAVTGIARGAGQCARPLDRGPLARSAACRLRACRVHVAAPIRPAGTAEQEGRLPCFVPHQRRYAHRGRVAYAPKSNRGEYRSVAKRAVRWLETAKRASTEDHVSQILGPKLGGGSRGVIRKAGEEQIPALASDAYATGQALVELRESGIIVPRDTQYQRGVRYLVDPQMEDGSWLVRTRSPSFQPYFDSDFPHAFDQFISAAASNWAVPGSSTCWRRS